MSVVRPQRLFGGLVAADAIPPQLAHQTLLPAFRPWEPARGGRECRKVQQKNYFGLLVCL